MENYINTLPVKQVVLFLVIGALLHFIFYLINSYALPVLLKKKSLIGLYWNRIQIVSWTIFLLLFFSSLFRANMYLTLAISAIVIGIGWSFWTNFFAGIVIKFTNQFKTGDTVSSELVQGKVKSIRTTFTEVINSKGELLIIPNSKMKKAILRHHSTKSTLHTSSFTCNAKLHQNDMYKYAMNCPYFTGNQSIKISKNQNNIYEIKAMLLDESLKQKAVTYFNNLS